MGDRQWKIGSEKGLEISPYKKLNQIAFYIPVSYILGATLLCTEHYELLEEKTNGVFKIDQYSRDEMVLDMDRWSNRIKAFKLSLTL